jgi:tRNA(Ile)-lysidine synthetase-like protein
VADVAAVARGDRPGVELPGGVVAAREGPWVVLLAVSTAGAPSPAGTLPVPGTLVASGIEAEAWIEDRPPHPWPLGRVPAVLDGDAVGLELALRTAETGDRLEIVGGSKSVHAALADAGIPARLRPGWPVWAAHGKLVRVAGIATAAWARPGPATQRFLWIVERMEQP